MEELWQDNTHDHWVANGCLTLTLVVPIALTLAISLGWTVGLDNLCISNTDADLGRYTIGVRETLQVR